MQSNHVFKVKLNWNHQDEARKTYKNHSIEIDKKPNLNVSAAPTFKGDATHYNPEDLLLSSLVSCHMMSYLYCCNQAKIDVLQYFDQAEALLKVEQDGSGRIIKVLLNPTVYIHDEAHYKQAMQLHVKANKLCFIANSCNFIVEHQPIVVLVS